MNKYFVTSLLIFSTLISLKAVSSELIGTWKHKGFACGANYRFFPTIRNFLKSKRKIFSSDNTYSTTGKIPGAKGLFNCDITATGSYTITGSVINIEIVSANANCNQTKDFPISISKLLEEVILPKYKKQRISQNFILIEDTLYLQLSAHTPARQYPLLPPSSKGQSTPLFQVPANTLKPPPSCKKDETVYEVFSRVK